MVSSDLDVYCGEPVIKFFNSDDDSQINPDLFKLDRTAISPNPFQFMAGECDELSAEGTHTLYWEFCYSNAPENTLRGPDFVFEVIDLCNPPADYSKQPEWTVPTLEDQVYYIGTPSEDYQIPEFSVSPSYCEERIIYEFDIT